MPASFGWGLRPHISLGWMQSRNELWNLLGPRWLRTASVIGARYQLSATSSSFSALLAHPNCWGWYPSWPRYQMMHQGHDYRATCPSDIRNSSASSSLQTLRMPLDAPSLLVWLTPGMSCQPTSCQGHQASSHCRPSRRMLRSTYVQRTGSGLLTMQPKACNSAPISTYMLLLFLCTHFSLLNTLWSTCIASTCLTICLSSNIF